MEKEIGNVLKRLSTNQSEATIDSLISTLTTIRANAESAQTPEEALTIYKQILPATKKAHEQITDAHKELYSSLSKYAKSVDKRLKPDVDIVDWDPNAFAGKDNLLNQAVALHLIREGRFNLAEVFVREAGLTMDVSLSVKFTEMYQILESIRAGDLSLALEWARARRELLYKRGSFLEFNLVRLQFLKYVATGSVKEALKYASTEFANFKDLHMKEIQRLMGCLIYVKRLANSPYKDLLDETLWSDIQHSFTRDFCQLLGLSSDSPLYTALVVGHLAQPTINKMSSILKDKSGLEWTSQGELPVEIQLPDSQRFHSVFACPVSKELGTDENPPMMMVCGHVVCKGSLNQLCKGNQSARFKCPYCPSESTAAQAQRVYF